MRIKGKKVDNNSSDKYNKNKLNSDINNMNEIDELSELEDSNELYDIEINKLINEFNSDEIEIPDRLDEELSNKLDSLRPKKNKVILKAIVACALAIIISYTSIPSFRTFANDVIKLFLEDSGIQNAADHGYSKIEGTTLNIGDYKIEIDNIYLDELRLTFDAYITNPKVDMSSSSEYSYHIWPKINDDNNSVTVSYTEEKNGIKLNIQLVGEGIANVLEGKSESLDIELELSRLYRAKYNTEKTDEEILGKNNFIIEIPKTIYKNKKVYEINKTIDNKDAKVTIKSLEVSPTMMYLDSNVKLDGVYGRGLYNLSILSDNGNVYRDTMTLSGIGKEFSHDYRQTIVPSIYYDSGKKVTLKADGVIVQPEPKDIEIKLDDTYPKKIEYFNTTMWIENVEYKGSELEIYVRSNKEVSYAGNSKLDGEYETSAGKNQTEGKDDVYIFRYKTEEKENYNFSLVMMMKYKIPIKIDIPIENNK